LAASNTSGPPAAFISTALMTLASYPEWSA
jgi:hypothetical protein